jgi:thymidylate synthase ThyX
MSYNVRIVGDTVSPHVKTARITSFEIYAPRFLLAEINTHRILAKSAQSSRAIPVEKRIEGVVNDPFIPHFGKNNRGMQSNSVLDEAVRLSAERVWVDHIANTVIAARVLKDKEAHKQWVNRMLEPYAHFYGVITGTEWENFWNLRTSESAQPEFQELAKLMLKAYNDSKPLSAHYHLPFIEDERHQFGIRSCFKISSARCARVSYKNHDGTEFDATKDLQLCEDLISGGHLSPFDHPATADTLRSDDGDYFFRFPKDHRQFYGWMPHRVDIEKEKGWTLRRCPFEPIPISALT